MTKTCAGATRVAQSFGSPTPSIIIDSEMIDDRFFDSFMAFHAHASASFHDLGFEPQDELVTPLSFWGLVSN
jgi:hypothetical protein